MQMPLRLDLDMLTYIILLMSLQTLKVEQLDQGTIIRVSLARPKALNTMNPTFFTEISQVFRKINQSETVRAVVLQAEGKLFTAGLDLKEAAGLGVFNQDSEDPSRSAIKIYQVIRDLQQAFLDVYNCRVPVVVGINGLCIGGGIDLVCMADIRYCTKDAQFTIKEIDMGIAADLGTLKLFPNRVGNHSTFKELAYTGRYMKSDEALRIGFVSKVVENYEHLTGALLETARTIATKSPIGIYTIKQTLNAAEFRQISDSLQFVARMNAVMLQTKDINEAVSTSLSKKMPQFPKL